MRTTFLTNYHSFISEILFILGPKRKRLPEMVGLFILSSIIDLCGIGLVGPYIALLIDPDLAMSPRVEKILSFFQVDSLGPRDLILLMGAILLAIFSLKATSGILIQRKILKYCWGHHRELRARLFNAYQAMPYETLQQRHSSEFLQSFQHHSIQFAMTLTMILRLLSEAVVVLVIATLLAVTNFMALTLLAILMASTIAMYDRYFRNQLTKSGELSNLNNIEAISSVRAAVYGLKEIRVLGKEHFFFSQADNASRAAAQHYAESHLLRQAPRYLLEVCLVFFLVLVVSITIMNAGNISELVPTLGVFGVAALRLNPSANLMSTALAQLRFSRHGITTLAKDLRLANCYPKKGDLKVRNHEIQSAQTFDQLEFHNVSYTYPNRDCKALTDITLRIKKGEAVGIVGPSGSGKSTLVDVLLHLLIPQQGTVSFNEHSLYDRENSWYSMIAYIPQEPLLMEGSIRDNITLERSQTAETEPKIFEAIAKAQLTKTLDSLEKGIETNIGEAGTRLSGGQRQRIALARAFYHDRQLLILDEATSALDNETERYVVAEFARLKRDHTTIVIAHRFSTVQHCDWIYQLEAGVILNQGPPSEILGSQG